MNQTVHDWITGQIGEGESAGSFSPEVKVWSEMAVRAAVVRALENYDKGKQAEQN